MNKTKEKEFETIFWEHKEMVYHLALKYFRNQIDAEDIVQEVFLKVYLNVGKFRNEAKLKSWIYRIALNEIFGEFRRRKKHINNRLWVEDISSHGFEEEQNLIKEMKRDFCKYIKKLPKKRGKVMFLRVLEQLSFKEIGMMLSISEDSAKNLFSLGLKTVRQAFGN